MRLVNGVPVADDPAHAAQQAAGDTFRQARVPASVSNWQFRAQLRRGNPTHLANLKSFILLQSDEIQDWWQYSHRIPRNHPNVEAARVALGYTNAQVNSLFRDAWLLT